MFDLLSCANNWLLIHYCLSPSGFTAAIRIRLTRGPRISRRSQQRTLDEFIAFINDRFFLLAASDAGCASRQPQFSRRLAFPGVLPLCKLSSRNAPSFQAGERFPAVSFSR